MSAFGTAFAAARKAGKKEFTWNGKQYHTKTKEEMSKPVASTGPKARPKASPAMPSPMVPPRPKEVATSPMVPPRADAPKRPTMTDRAARKAAGVARRAAAPTNAVKRDAAGAARRANAMTSREKRYADRAARRAKED